MTRVHLGCGKKMLAGYINCDLEPCFGGKPDVLFNMLERWPFADESATEVLAVHVWEHFYEWDHPHLASEALRVLAKDGCLVLEMPDLMKCARNLLDGETPQNSYWGIYADPQAAKGDEHQMHHSGWWPNKLIRFLLQAGFRHCEAMNPQHKGRRHIRDFRVEAWK